MNHSKSVPETEQNGSAPVWFHCNICSIQPTEHHYLTLTFFVTSCQHIFCYECLRNFASQSPDVCPLCKTTTRVIEFRKIGPDIAAMFESILPGVMTTMKSTQFHFRQAEHFVQVLNKKRATLQADIDKNRERTTMIKEEVGSIQSRRERRMAESFNRKRPEPDEPKPLSVMNLFDGIASAHSDFQLNTTVLAPPSSDSE